MNGKTHYNWAGIDWKNTQDVDICKNLCLLDREGQPVLKRGKSKHPSRERVRQKRMETYREALERVLRVSQESEAEVPARRALELALRQECSTDMVKALRRVSRVEVPVKSRLRGALAEARRIYRPKGWHSRKGTSKERIAELPTTTMTAKEISQQVGCGVSYVAQALRELGMICKRASRGLSRKYDWDSIKPWEWTGPNRLTDKEIAKKLNVKNPAVVTTHRNRYGISKRPRLAREHRLRQVKVGGRRLLVQVRERV